MADEHDFGAAIRDGRLDGRDAEVLAALRAIVRAKLEVANPRYLQASSAAPPKKRTRKEKT